MSYVNIIYGELCKYIMDELYVNIIYSELSKYNI